MGRTLKLRCPKPFCKYHYFGKELYLGPIDLWGDTYGILYKDAYVNTDLSKEQLDFLYKNEDYYFDIYYSLFVCPKCGRYVQKEYYCFRNRQTWEPVKLNHTYKCSHCGTKLELPEGEEEREGAIKIYCPKHRNVLMKPIFTGFWD